MSGAPSPVATGRGLRRAVLGTALVVALAAGGALGARATRGAQVTADEPQYLLSAISLAEDHDLDISDELADGRWRDFHEAPLPRQTEPRADGSELSPHDPLLPLLLAGPVALGGWVGAKLALALMAGVLAGALVWVAVRRFDVAPVVAGVVVGAFGVTAPLTAYGTQVYPELPAALAVTVALGAVTGPLGRRGRWVVGLSVVALPWLAVKYTPVAAVIAVLAVVALARRGDRRAALALSGGLFAAGIAFLALHRAVYGGWTVYAAGDHFVGGELTVMGSSPDYPGRSIRLVGLLLDRHFGLVAWSPLFLLTVPALAALARRRPPGSATLAAVAAAGWLNATYVALTMHGWWWPGRQVVVVIPALVLATAWWVGRLPRLVPLVLVGAGAGLVLWWSFARRVLGGGATLVVDLDRPGAAGVIARGWRTLLPDDRALGGGGVVLFAAWAVVLGLLAVVGWRTAPTSSGPSASLTSSVPSLRSVPLVPSVPSVSSVEASIPEPEEPTHVPI